MRVSSVKHELGSSLVKIRNIYVLSPSQLLNPPLSCSLVIQNRKHGFSRSWTKDYDGAAVAEYSYCHK